MAEEQLFVVGVGPQKTASTWLYTMLAQFDTLVFPSDVKETFFWDSYYERGLKWYFSHFDRSGSHKMAEVGPTYFHSPLAAERLKAHNTNLKIIVTLRNPVARSYSLYLHQKMRGRVSCDFWQAVDLYPEIIEGSRYSKYLPMWIDSFGSDNVLVLMQEEIAQTPKETLRRLNEFLGLEQMGEYENITTVVNKATLPKSPKLAKLTTILAGWMRKYRLYNVINIAKRLGLKKLIYSGREVEETPSLSLEDKKKLSEIFAEDTRFVEQLTGKNLVAWKSQGVDK
jgi:hypothetical protein